METRGPHIFSRMSHVPPAFKLNRVFRKAHNIVTTHIEGSDETSDKNNCVDANNTDNVNDGIAAVKKELLPYERTWLIHPSPVSQAALDFAFQLQPTAYSPYSVNLFQHLATIRKAFSLFILGDLLLTLEHVFPHMFTLTVKEKNTEDVDIENIIKQHSTTLVSVLDKTNFINRVNKISLDFQRAVTIYLTLSVIPVLSPSDGTCMVNFDMARVAKSLESFVEHYMSTIERIVSLYKVTCLKTLRTDVILTQRDGKYACSDYCGRPYMLWTFDASGSVCNSEHGVRSPLIDMMQHEFQYRFANATHRLQTLDKMTRTRVVVSSSLTHEADAILDEVRKGAMSSTHKEMISDVRKEHNKIKVYDAKSKLITDTLITPNSESNLASELATLKQRYALDAASQRSTILENSLRKHYRELSNGNNTLLSDSFADNLAQQKDTTINIGTLHDATPNSSRKDSIQYGRIVQNKLMHSQISKVISEKNIFERETKLLRQEVTDMQENLIKLSYHNKIGKAEIELLKKDLQETKKQRDTTRAKVEDYGEIVEELKRSVAEMLDQTNAGEEERARLLGLFMRKDDTLDSNHDNEARKRSVLDLLQLVMDSLPNEYEKYKNVTLSERDASMYDRMLKGNSVFVIPSFTNVPSKEALACFNSWLPCKWMHDKPLMDNVLMSCKTESTPLRKDAAGRQAVVNTPDLYILDINPTTLNEVQKVKKAIEASNGFTMLDSVFERKFLNVQFPVQGSVDSSINAPLKDKWHHVTHQLLQLSGERFTKNGQRVGAMVSNASIQFYVVPFVTQYLGERPYVSRITTLVAAILGDVTLDDDDMASFSHHERLISVFLSKKYKQEDDQPKAV